MVYEDTEDPRRFSLIQCCSYSKLAARELLWPIHVTYRTSSGKKGSFVFSERSFELTIPLADNEAVWFNADMLGFYLPIPSTPYLIDKLVPVLDRFSEADRFGILYVMKKSLNPDLLMELLPIFKYSNSLAVKYLADHIVNQIQLTGSKFETPPINESLLIALHKEVFLNELNNLKD